MSPVRLLSVYTLPSEGLYEGRDNEIDEQTYAHRFLDHTFTGSTLHIDVSKLLSGEISDLGDWLPNESRLVCRFYDTNWVYHPADSVCL